MSLSLSCACGARFEVEESLARQTVSCPECQKPVQASSAARQPLRTSGWAVAGTVCGLVLAFTGIGTVLAILFGILALLSISRNRAQVVGAGYAIFSIAWGVVFTALFVFAVVKGEVFGVGEGLREVDMGREVERGGPLETRRPAANFVITRPGPKWYIAKPSLAERFGYSNTDLVLVNLARPAYVGVETTPEATLDAARDELLRRYRDNGGAWDFRRNRLQPRRSGLVVRHDKRLPSSRGLERAELLFDVKVDGTLYTFLVHVLHDPEANQAYLIQAWVPRGTFSQAEAEVRQALDSFRLLSRPENE
jgi:hypothetical protein